MDFNVVRLIHHISSLFCVYRRVLSSRKVRPSTTCLFNCWWPLCNNDLITPPRQVLGTLVSAVELEEERRLRLQCQSLLAVAKNLFSHLGTLPLSQLHLSESQRVFSSMQLERKRRKKKESGRSYGIGRVVRLHLNEPDLCKARIAIVVPHLNSRMSSFLSSPP